MMMMMINDSPNISGRKETTGIITAETELRELWDFGGSDC
jgi:hypothetical protein